MRRSHVAADINEACLVHARLLDSFIELVREELKATDSAFLEDSLNEMMEQLRSERRLYGTVTPLVRLVPPMAVAGTNANAA